MQHSQRLSNTLESRLESKRNGSLETKPAPSRARYKAYRPQPPSWDAEEL